MKLKANRPLAQLNRHGFHKPDPALISSIFDELKKHLPQGVDLTLRTARRHCLRHNGLEAALVALHFEKMLVLVDQFPEVTPSNLEGLELLKKARTWGEGVVSYEAELAHFDLKNCKSFETRNGWLIMIFQQKRDV